MDANFFTTWVETLVSIAKKIPMLNDRELRIATLVGLGYLNKEIAGQLKLSEITVKKSRRHLCDKIGIRSGSTSTALAQAFLLHMAMQPKNAPAMISHILEPLSANIEALETAASHITKEAANARQFLQSIA